MSKLYRKSYIVVLLLIIIANVTAYAETITTPRVFTRGSFVYVVEPAHVTFLSMDTRGAHVIYHAADPMLQIVSAVQDGDVVWISTALGAVIALDMQRGMIEEFSRSRIDGGGLLDADRRHVWVARPDTLHRMNKTTREWTSIPIPHGGNVIAQGIISFNDYVHIVAEDAVYVYGAAADEWSVVPHGNFAIGEGEFYRANGFAFFARGSVIYRYDPSARRMTTVNLRGRVHTVGASDAAMGRLLIGAGNRVYRLDAESPAGRAVASVPPVRAVKSLASFDGRIVAANDRGVALYTTPFDFDFVPYPEYVNVGEEIFAFTYEENILLYTNNNFVIYDHGRRLWSNVQSRKREPPTRQGWSENGAFMPLNQNVSATLHGNFTIRQEPTIAREENEFGSEEIKIDIGETFGNATITARVESVEGRTFDVVIDNAPHQFVPQKGLYYDGIEGDVFDRARYGLQAAGQTGIMQTQRDFEVMTEGGAAFFSGNRTAQNRDRAMLSGTVGGGHVLSRTEWRTFRFDRGGNYFIDVENREELLSSTIRFFVDGVPLPESDYIYNNRTGHVRLLRRDKTDPTSVIQISFARRVLPDESGTFEPFPENHFGRYGFAQGAVSPRSWMSFDAGVLAHGTDADSITPIITAGVPVEYRRGASRSLLFHPQISYDNLSGAHSAAFDVGVRENRAFGSYSGALISRDYNTLDRQTFGGANVFGEHDLDVGYDIMNNLRANFRTLHRETNNDFADEFDRDKNRLSFYELRTNYAGRGVLPDVELSASTREMLLQDSRRKEMFGVRVFDNNAEIFGSGSRLRRVGYDFAWSEYNEEEAGGGRTVYGNLDITPTDNFTISGGALYRQNPESENAKTEIAPTLEISGANILRGVDANVDYTVNVADLRSGGSDILTQRAINTYIYPGEFVNFLRGVIFYLGYESESETHAPNTTSPLRYAFLTDDHTLRERAREEAGVAYFPIENLLLSSLYARNTNSENPTSHDFYERVKYWFANGSSAEARVTYSFNDLQEFIRGSMLYEHNFGGGVLAGIGAFANYDDFGERDTININGIMAGPQFLLSISKILSGNIRAIENSHIVRVSFHEDENVGTGVDYALYLRLRMPPNISLVANLNFNYNDADKFNGGGALYLHAGF